MTQYKKLRLNKKSNKDSTKEQMVLKKTSGEGPRAATATEQRRRAAKVMKGLKRTSHDSAHSHSKGGKGERQQ